MRVVNPLEILLVTCLNEYILFPIFIFLLRKITKSPSYLKRRGFFVLIIEGIFLIDEEMDAVRAFVPSVVIKTIRIDHFAYNIFSRGEFFACYSG